MITAEFLRTLDNDELHARTVRAAKSERKIMHVVLLHIREVERRRLYVIKKRSSIQQYCIQDLKYSESSANRRVQAARLLDLLPELSESVQSGALNLTTLTVVQSVMRAEEKRSGEKIHIEDKRELLAYLENKTTDQALRTLAQAFPDAQPPVEKTRPLANDKTQVSFVMPKSLAQKLERVRELESHKHNHLGWAELFEIIADFYLARRAPEMKPVRKKSTKKEKPQNQASTQSSKTNGHIKQTSQDAQDPSAEASTHSTPATETPSHRATIAESQSDSNNIDLVKTQEERPRSIQTSTLRRRKKHSASVQRLLHLRSGSQCEHVDPVSGLRCTRRFHLQIDHKQAFSRGGSDEFENLQLLCRAHNLHKSARSVYTRQASGCASNIV